MVGNLHLGRFNRSYGAIRLATAPYPSSGAGDVMGKMGITQIKMHGAFGSAVAVAGLVRLAISVDNGWLVVVDVAAAIYWAWTATRFARLKIIVIEKPLGSVTVDDEQVWP